MKRVECGVYGIAAFALLLKLRILDEGVVASRKQRERLGSNSGR